MAISAVVVVYHTHLLRYFLKSYKIKIVFITNKYALFSFIVKDLTILPSFSDNSNCALLLLASKDRLSISYNYRVTDLSS